MGLPAEGLLSGVYVLSVRNRSARYNTPEESTTFCASDEDAILNLGIIFIFVFS